MTSNEGAQTTHSPPQLLTTVIQWRADQVGRSAFEVQRIASSDLKNWHFQEGHLRHTTGGFFSVVGFAATLPGLKTTRTQPYILQPEVGILGFLLCRSGNEIKLLVQAKTEPGNCGGNQLSPSFQCTESNYRGLHGGISAPFRNIFADHKTGNPIFDSLQSEQGTRFVNKYNRNTIIEVNADDVDTESPSKAAWRWLSIPEIGFLLTQDLIVNTDARSVIATANWHVLHPEGQPFARWQDQGGFEASLAQSFYTSLAPHRRAEILNWLTTRREPQKIVTHIQPLNDLEGWNVTSEGIEPATQNSGMAIRYYQVYARDREVPSWTQPLVTSETNGLVLLVIQKRDAVLRFALRLSSEPGFANFSQLSATHQNFPGEVDGIDPSVPLLAQSKALAPDHQAIIFDCQMSEEGGRFFQDINRYLVLHLPDAFEHPESPEILWLTLAEIEAVKQEQGVFTNEFRSILSLFVRYF